LSGTPSLVKYLVLGLLSTYNTTQLTQPTRYQSHKKRRRKRIAVKLYITPEHITNLSTALVCDGAQVSQPSPSASCSSRRIPPRGGTPLVFSQIYNGQYNVTPRFAPTDPRSTSVSDHARKKQMYTLFRTPPLAGWVGGHATTPRALLPPQTVLPASQFPAATGSTTPKSNAEPTTQAPTRAQ